MYSRDTDVEFSHQAGLMQYVTVGVTMTKYAVQTEPKISLLSARTLL